MRIFIFNSETSSDLQAFGGDLAGSQLPSQFKPWRVVGAIAPGQDPPYKLSRAVIETAINDRGFQLFRLSKKGEDSALGDAPDLTTSIHICCTFMPRWRRRSAR